MFTITKEFHFSASHQLSGLPADHQCARLHGHNYIVVLELQAEHLDKTGFVVDFGDLGTFKKYIDSVLDHQHLNYILSFQTSAENLAKHLYEVAAKHYPQVSAVRISETPKTWAEYRP